jgi:hypothetical protein
MVRSIRRLLVVVLFLLLTGCSEQQHVLNVEFRLPLTYSFEALRYTTSSSQDIITMITDNELDLRLALRQAKDQFLIESLPVGVDNTIVLLDQISEAAGVSLKTIIAYSSSELLTAATTNAVELTIDDIVGFNDLKATLALLGGSIRIDKVDIIESKLERDLSEDERQGFDLLQQFYIKIISENYQFNLITTNLESLRLELEGLYTPPTEAEILLILDAFAILRTIAEDAS